MAMEQLLKVLPLMLLLCLGYLLRRTNILEKKDGKTLVKLFVKIALPATIFLAFSNLNLTGNAFVLAGLGLLVVMLLSVISYVIIFAVNLAPNIRSIFLIIMPALAPATVAYPFFITLYGEMGLSTIALMNIGNIIFLFTADKYIAMREGHVKNGSFLRGMMEDTTILATIFGLAFAYFNIHYQFMTDFFNLLAGASTFIIMIALGVDFEWKKKIIEQITPIIITKTSAGLLIGYFVATMFNLNGLERIAMIIYAFVPASAITYAFVSEQKLDKEFEADLLSFALPIGAISTGLFLVFAEQILLTNIVLYLGVIGTFVGVIGMYYLDRKHGKRR